MTDPETMPTDIILPIGKDRFVNIYTDPLYMTMSEFVIIMRRAQGRLKHLESKYFTLKPEKWIVSLQVIPNPVSSTSIR